MNRRETHAACEIGSHLTVFLTGLFIGLAALDIGQFFGSWQ
jgi:hypothetical protein